MRHRYTPSSACGSKPQAVSSRTSRTTAFEQRFAVLDVAGGLVEDEAAVDALLDDQEAAVGLGNSGDGDVGRAQPCAAIIAAGVGPGRRLRSAAAGDAQAVLGCAGVPDAVEFLQVQPRRRRVVDVGDAVPACRRACGRRSRDRRRSDRRRRAAAPARRRSGCRCSWTGAGPSRRSGCCRA